MHFSILGPLEVRDERGPVPLGGAKQRVVVAVLVLDANRPVSAERLAQALWGDDAPPRAVKRVHVLVSRLRKLLGPDSIETSAAGYRLLVGHDEIDLARFERRVDEGRSALRNGDPERAAEAVRSALDLWRGAPLADLVGEAFLQTDIARLEDLRLTAIALRVEADLECGRDDELVGELRRLAAEFPAHEQFVRHLMLALYRAGRQTDALETYGEARERLLEASGIEPGPDLRSLHAAILRQDHSLLRQDTGLPPELVLATASPLEGRDAELAWLRDRWNGVRAGAGAVITLAGEKGIGKSHLAAAFASEAHARGATVFYTSAGGPPTVTFGVLARAYAAHGPSVLIVDDADRAPPEVRQKLDAFGRDIADTPILALVLGENGRLDHDGLVLSPLDRSAVRAIVTRYSPAAAADQPPEEWLLGASRGVPGMIHELAEEWAQKAAREAARRIENGARRTASQRADLRSMERELAADVVVLEAARETEPVGAGSLVCPFKGLASFQVADAPYFFGRERLVAALVARLVGAPLLAIVGPSGSGKSSVLRAGLLPALAAGVLPGSDSYPQALIRPGAHPMAELEPVIERASGGPVVLAVDQFEELFTICDDERERAEFVAELVRLARASEGQGAIAIAMRADYYGRCAEYPELSRMLAANHVLVGAMRDEELRRAVECPAQRAHVVVESDLVDALVNDVRDEPGALPLLSTALLELWQGLDGSRRLRHADYAGSGGVRGAVARLGERAFTAMDRSQQEIARRVLLRLAPVDEEGAVERRRVARAELGGETTDDVVALLADSRLITIHADCVELTHEALLREWPRLRGWIEESQAVRRVERTLSTEARKWVRLNRDEDALLRGALLTEVQESIDPAGLDVATEREFLLASLEQRRRQRLARRHRYEAIIGALAAGLVAIGIVALIAINNGNTAERERNEARAHTLALRSVQMLDTDPEVALRLALWADETAHTPEATAALRQAVLSFHELAKVKADSVTAQTAAFSPDGKVFVSGGDDGVARLYDSAGRSELAAVKSEAVVNSARFSPDGQQIALGYDSGVVRVTDAGFGRARTVLTVDGEEVQRVAFSADGRTLAAGMGDGSVHLIALDRRGEAPSRVLPASDAAINGVGVDRNDRIVTADADGNVTLWNADLTPARTLTAGDGVAARDVDFSPDGATILAVGEDRIARLWDGDGGELLAEVPAGPRALTSAAFSPDSRRFAVASYDGAIRVYTVDGLALLFTLRGQQSRVLDVGFGASSDRIVSAGDDGYAKVWDASGIRAFRASATSATNADFSPSGDWIVSGSESGSVSLFNAATGARVRSFAGDPSPFVPAEFSPINDEIAIGRDMTSSLERVTVPDGRVEVALRLKPQSGINVARFDPTGRRLVLAGYQTNEFLIRDIRTRKTWSLRGGPKEIVAAQASPDGRQAVAAGTNGRLYIWNLAQPDKPIRTIGGLAGHINSMEYSADGRILVTSPDRTARILDPNGRRRPVILRGHTDEVRTASFTDNGKRVLTASADGTVLLWDARGGEPLVTLQSNPDIAPYDVSPGPNAMLATLDDHNVVRVFRCKVCGSDDEIRAAARALKPRRLNADEKRLYAATG
jgi:WD40 repeat protein/DNA-binding SARP family transcriptional activator